MDSDKLQTLEDTINTMTNQLELMGEYITQLHQVMSTNEIKRELCGFYSTKDIAVYVRFPIHPETVNVTVMIKTAISYNIYRPVNAPFEVNGGMVNISLDSPQTGYVIVEDANPSPCLQLPAPPIAEYYEHLKLVDEPEMHECKVIKERVVAEPRKLKMGWKFTNEGLVEKNDETGDSYERAMKLVE